MPHGAAGVLSPLFQRVGLTLRPPVTEEASLADGGFRSEQVWDGFPRLPSRWLVTTKGLAEGQSTAQLGDLLSAGSHPGACPGAKDGIRASGPGEGGVTCASGSPLLAMGTLSSPVQLLCRTHLWKKQGQVSQVSQSGPGSLTPQTDFIWGPHCVSACGLAWAPQRRSLNSESWRQVIGMLGPFPPRKPLTPSARSQELCTAWAGLCPLVTWPFAARFPHVSVL